MKELLQPLMPVEFDGNEIYSLVIISLIITGVVWIMRKDQLLSSMEVIFIWVFNLFYSSLGDYFLAMEPYDFYDTVDRNSGELTDIILQNLGYPGFALIAVHFYVKYQPKKWYYAGYVLLAVLVTLALETIGVKYFELYVYKDWSVFKSFLFYIPVYLLNFWLIDKVRAYIEKRRKAVASQREGEQI